MVLVPGVVIDAPVEVGVGSCRPAVGLKYRNQNVASLDVMIDGFLRGGVVEVAIRGQVEVAARDETSGECNLGDSTGSSTQFQ